MFAVWLGLTALFVLWVQVLGLDDDEGQALTERLGTEGTLNVLILIVVLTVLGPPGRGVCLSRLHLPRAAQLARSVAGGDHDRCPVRCDTHRMAAARAGCSNSDFPIGMCLLYHWTGSLYPGIAVQTINNSIPLALALDWTWQTPLLIVGSTLAALTISRLIALRLDDTHLRRHSGRVGAQAGRAS